MRVLLVAPSSGLEYGRREVDRIVSELKPTLLSGSVSVSRLLEVEGGHECVWFVAHGGEGGIELSDGVEMGLGVLGSVVAAQGAELLVLNTCESVALALAINEALGVAVVATVSKVEDVQAYVTGASFAHALGGGSSGREAYEIARPINNKDYIYLPAGGKVGEKIVRGGGVGGSDGAGFWGESRSREFSELSEAVRMLKWRIDGKPDYGVKGLGESMREIEERLEGIEGGMRELMLIQREHVVLLKAYGESLDDLKDALGVGVVRGEGRSYRGAWLLAGMVFFLLSIAAGITIWNSLTP